MKVELTGTDPGFSSQGHRNGDELFPFSFTYCLCVVIVHLLLSPHWKFLTLLETKSFKIFSPTLTKLCTLLLQLQSSWIYIRSGLLFFKNFICLRLFPLSLDSLYTFIRTTQAYFLNFFLFSFIFLSF